MPQSPKRLRAFHPINYMITSMDYECLYIHITVVIVHHDANVYIMEA